MLKNIIEALIFAAAKGISYQKIRENFSEEYTEREIKEAIKALQEEYSGEKGVYLIEFNKNYQFQSNPTYGELLKEALTQIKERQLSNTVLQTLSIIAYKQPIDRREIEKLRGNISCDYAIGVLLKAELIDVKERKSSSGHAALYGTTDLFLKRFQLKSLSDLPEYQAIVDSVTSSDKFNKRSGGVFDIRDVKVDADAELDEIAAALDAVENIELPDFLKDDDYLVIGSDD
jgi:segregation and condensation protein B